MADILIDVEVRGNQKVTTAVKNVQTLQTNVKRLSDAMSKGSLSKRQYYKGIEQLADATGKSEQDLRNYANTIRRIEREEKKAKAVKAAAAKAARDKAKADREAAKAAREAARAARENADREEYLKRAYSQGYAQRRNTINQYLELREALRRNIITTEEYRESLQRLRRQNVGNIRSQNNLGVAIQQTGYQVGDFFVQVQSGTNPMVAFGQQATQLVGILPLVHRQLGLSAMAAIGLSTALGIAIPIVTALGAAWMRTREKVEDTTTQLQRVEEAISSLEGSTETLRMDLAQLAEIYGENAAKVRDYNTALAELKSAQARGRLSEEIQIARREVEQLTQTLGEALGPKMQELADKVGLTFDEAVKLQEQLNTFSNLPIEQQGDAFIGIYQTLVDMGVPLDALPEGLRQALIEAGSTLEAMERLRVATEQAERAANGLANTDISSGVASAAANAENLARQFGLAYTAAYNLARLQQSSGTKLGFSNAGGSVAGPGGLPLGSGRTVGTFGAGGAVFGGNLRDLPSPEDISSGGGGGGGASGPNPIEQAQEYLEKIQKEAEFKRTLVGLTDEQATQEERRNQLLTQLNGYEEGLGEQYSERINQIIQMEAETRKLIEAEQQREQMMTSVQGHIESAFMSFVDGSKSVEDAFKSMLRNIILEIYQTKVAKPAANAIMDLLFSAKGNVFSGGAHVKAYADGGVVNRTTAFPMRGGVGIMGEAGPEAIMPLKRGKNGKLGVQMEGSSGDVVIHQNFNFSANGDDSVKRIIRGEIPRITEVTKAAVVDAKRRGGSYGRSF